MLSTMKHSIGKMGSIRTLKTLRTMNQAGGFDCPGCAWPDPDVHRTTFEFCENGAKAVADESMRKKIGAKFFARWSVQELADKSDLWLNAQGRLVEPMYKASGATHYGPISWDDAFERIAIHLKQLASPDEALFYTSGRTSNEAAFLYQLFARVYGTNNLPDCSNMCHESSGTAMTEVIGSGKGTVTLEDLHRSSLIIVMGQNPGSNHPRMLTALAKAKQNGGSIIHVNPLPETGLVRFKHPQDYLRLSFRSTQLADLHLQVRLNGDVAFLKGVMKYLLAEAGRSSGVMDHEFIAEHTQGFEEFAQALEGVGWEEILLGSGLSREQIESAAQMIAAADSMIICWAMGLTQHQNGVANVQEIMNLLLLGGHIGREGAGACPVRGHSNVQGDRTMGIWERPEPAFLDRLEQRFAFSAPRRHGLDTVSAIDAMYDGRAKVFVAMGGNFISAAPDTDRTAEGMRRTSLSVQVSTKLNRSHLVTGDEALMLPCLGRTERDVQSSGPQFVSVENSMGIVHSSTGKLKPASDRLRSEPAIIAGMAAATLAGTRIDWAHLVADYDRIRDGIESCVPGFEDFNSRIRDSSGFYLPNPPRDDRTFNTPSRRALFTVHNIPDNEPPAGHYMMMTIRSHDQYNTTIYGMDDRYRGIKGSRFVVLMNQLDLEEEGWSEQQEVTLISDSDGVDRSMSGFRVIPYSIPRKCVATYFPEANPLVPLSHVAERSNTPASKSVLIRIQAD